MNSVQLLGRLVRDPDIRYAREADDTVCVAKFVLAVRRYRKGNSDSADFIPCVAFGKNAEFVEKYLSQGMRIGCTGSILPGSYVNDEGKTIYTMEVNVTNFEFADSKSAGERSQQQDNSRPMPTDAPDGFINIPDGINEELPFN